MSMLWTWSLNVGGDISVEYICLQSLLVVDDVRLFLFGVTL